VSGRDDERRDVFGHLQGAAKELLAAARDAVDAADEFVSDPGRLYSLLFGRRRCPPDDAGREGAPRVERIDVDRPPTDHV
jgi:hypothetical protein